MAGIRYVHTNIVAKDWRRLAQFYIKALGCKRKPPERDIAGAWLDRATSLKSARLRGIHLKLPGYEDNGPTLEIFQYSSAKKSSDSQIDKPGFAHIAFSVGDVAKALAKVQRYGGGSVGQIVSAEIEGVGPINFVYARDPEGNIIELQKRE